MTFRATLPPVDFAYDDASDEAKRRRLLHQIEMIRVSFTEMAVRLNEGTACRLPHEQQKLFDFHPDPYLAANRMSEAYCRIVVAEMRIQEDDDTRAKRQAEEQARREQAAQAAEAAKRRQEEEAVAAPAEAKRDLVRRATGFAHRQSFPGLTALEREDLLGELLEDFEDFADYRDDPIEIVAEFCRTFARDAEAELSDIPAFAHKVGEPANAEKRLRQNCRAWAAKCVERFIEPDIIEALAPPAPPELAQGPPKAA
jgi:hypothetical protein